LEVKHFHVPARRSKTPENALSEKETLDHLAKVAGNVRFHFKAFQDLRHRIESNCETDEMGFMIAVWCPDVEDPELRLAELATRIFFEGDVEKPYLDMEQLEAILEPKHEDDSTDDEEPTSDSERRRTITFCGWRDGKPVTQVALQDEPFMNAESVAECGCSFTNYVFGGNMDLAHDTDGAPLGIVIKPWPEFSFWKVYADGGQTLGLSDFSKKALPSPVFHYPAEYK
jgi:hypothetical protein